MIITDKAQIKVAELRESNNLRLSGSDEIECYELIESDLKLPADATFTRSSIAYLSDGTKVAANQPRFEPGKFGKAIIVEEGTKNLLNNPTFEGESGLASCFTAYGSGVIYEIVNDGYLPNTLSQRLYYFSPVGDGSQMNKGIRFNITGQIGDVFTITFYGKGWEEHDNIAIYTNAATRLSLEKTQLEGGWTKYTSIIQLTDAVTIYYIRPNYNREYSFDCLINAPQLEAKLYATSFIDSTRATETLAIPTAGVLNPQEGTVEFWVKPLILTNYNNFFLMATSNGRFLLYFNSLGSARFDYGPNSSGPATPAGTIVANNWYYIVLRWSATTGKQALFINGVKYERDLPNGVATSFPSTVSVVNSYSAYIDDLRISSRARTDEEILAAYQSNKPLPVDEWTTYKLDSDDKVRITTQGQIICNELIEI